MSESLYQDSIPRQLMDLAALAGASCSDFQHQIIDSNTQFTGPGELPLLGADGITVTPNGGLIITRINTKVLFDTTDATLGAGAADWRSTDDLNPYGPFAVGSGGVGTIRLTQNGANVFAAAWDLGVINQPVLFCFTGGQTIQLLANPNQPAGKKLQLVTTLTTFSCMDQQVTNQTLKKNQTQVVTI